MVSPRFLMSATHFIRIQYYTFFRIEITFIANQTPYYIASLDRTKQEVIYTHRLTV